MKDIPIGEFVTIGNEVYKCVLLPSWSTDCSHCDITRTSHVCPACIPSRRQDRKDVAFILYDVIQDDEE